MTTPSGMATNGPLKTSILDAADPIVDQREHHHAKVSYLPVTSCCFDSVPIGPAALLMIWAWDVAVDELERCGLSSASTH